jgi:Xaa-Pro dipeptidase
MELLPKHEAEYRVGQLQGWMKQAAVDAVFVYQNADLFYFSGTVQAGMFCIPATGEPLFLVQKSLSRARVESPWSRLVAMPNPKKAPDILAGGGLKLDRVGLELDVLPANHYFRLQRLYSGVEFVDASDAIRNVRMIKSEYEVAQIRRAALMLDAAFRRIPEWMTPGITEIDIAARLEGFLRSQGHQGLTRMRGFNSELAYGTVSSGASASYPTCFAGPVGFVGLYPAVPNGAGTNRLKAGETMMVDYVGGFGGYIADETRTFGMGAVPEDVVQAHTFTIGLMAEIESMLRPGTICSEIYAAAMARIEESPYAAGFMGVGDSRVRFIGHGVGLELDELPVLAAGFDIPLQQGMTIAIEPKIFFPDRGGAGIENTYLITASGFENLTNSPTEILT